MSDDDLRVGLIGCGRQGYLLASALGRVPGARLVACCDPDPLARAAMPGARLVRCAEMGDLLALPDLDAVIVATPHHLLPLAVQAAAESGRHVFCEKPLATSASLARPAVDAAERAGVRLMVGYLLRFHPIRRRLKAILEAGDLGDLAYVVAGKGGPPLEGWTAQRASGGGQLLWVGSHLVDQLLWLIDKPVERVYAEIHRSGDGGADLTTVATLRFAGGLLAHLDCSQAAVEAYDTVEVAGAEGRARAEWRPRQQLTLQTRRLPEFARTRTMRQRSHPLMHEMEAELSEFVCAVRESRPPAITGYDALKVLQVLDAVVASAERGEPVALASVI